MYFNNNTGVVPNTQPMPKTGNWLPSDKYALLQKGLSQFKLSVTEEELAKGQCNHYYPNGTSALIQDPNGSGTCTCAICGTKFNTAEFDAKDVENATQNILDILNTIKVMYLSIDPQAAMEYFQIIPFVSKIPELYDIAVADFKKYEGVGQFTPAQGMNPFGMFGMLMGGYPMAPQAPMGGYPNAAQPGMANPMMGGQPFNPMYAQPQAPMGGYPMAQPGMANPMMGAQPGYQPQPTGYAFNPMGGAMPTQNPQVPTVNTNMPVQPQAPQAPAIPQQAAPTTDVKVDTKFQK